MNLTFWMTSSHGGIHHLIPYGQKKSLCGEESNSWWGERKIHVVEKNKCADCKIALDKSLTTAETPATPGAI